MCLLELLGMVFVTVVCVGLCWGCIVVMLVCALNCGTAVARGGGVCGCVYYAVRPCLFVWLRVCDCFSVSVHVACLLMCACILCLHGFG